MVIRLKKRKRIVIVATVQMVKTAVHVVRDRIGKIIKVVLVD